MAETSKELPNFSIGIDLLGPYLTSNKNKDEKNRKHISQIRWKTSSSKLVTRVHLALIFSIFPVNFELFIDSYRLPGSNVLTQTKVLSVACF